MNTEAHEAPESDPVNTAPYPFRGVLRFVTVFVVLVLVQLITYRYNVNSPANDWYLFQVARHTTGLLDLVGHGAALESTGAHWDPSDVRATLSESGEAAAHARTALSPWERWQYRAHTARKSSATPAELGPQVTFVLRPGIHHRIQELESTRPKDPGLSTVRDTEIQALRDEVRAALGDPEKRAAQQGKQFRFNVVPTCGATEIMAIFLAAVLAFPATWRQRVTGLAIGIPALYGINVIRLSCLAIIGAIDGGGAWFNFAHEYVWQALYVVIVVLLWLAWVEFLVRRPSI